MFEYSIEILKEEIEKNYEVKRGCPTPPEKELIKIGWVDEELQKAISILEKAGEGE